MKTLATAALALGFMGSAFAQLDPNKTVATVNGEAIKGAEYYRRMEFLPGVSKDMGTGMLEAPPGFLTILQLIGEKLILQLARERNVYPNDAEIKGEIQYRLAEDPNFIKDWIATGQSQADLESEIRYELARFKLQTAGVNITDQEVEKFYAENPSLFTSPRKYKLWVIAVRDQAAANGVEADLKGGKKFAEVAREKSIDMTRSIGGDLGVVPIDYLPTEAREAVSNTKIGSSSAWVDQANSKVKYFVEQITPEKKAELTAHLKTATRRKLMLDRGRVRNNLSKDLNDARLKAKVAITQEDFAKLYDKIVKQNRMIN